MFFKSTLTKPPSFELDRLVALNRANLQPKFTIDNPICLEQLDIFLIGFLRQNHCKPGGGVNNPFEVRTSPPEKGGIPSFEIEKYKLCGMRSQVGKVKVMGDPDRLCVRSGAGSDTGQPRHSRELQNTPKSARNGPELSKIRSFAQFWAVLDVLGLVLHGKPMGTRVGYTMGLGPVRGSRDTREE
ncbi:hypothetical protein BJ165DRAFT_1594628 [Panaeolus papilionaceus]|nr:hypothetical protein BJ165DRAFT_1594628 [Panaeolus papilionaceus]